jgi:hypothetical protein
MHRALLICVQDYLGIVEMPLSVGAEQRSVR